MNRVQAILTLDMENLPSNFSDILKEEQEVVAKWKEQGILEHLFLRQTKNGAVLIRVMLLFELVLKPYYFIIFVYLMMAISFLLLLN